MRSINSGSTTKKSLFFFFLSVSEIQTYLHDMFMGMLPQFSKRNRVIDSIAAIVPLVVLTPLKKLGDVLVFSKLKNKLGGKFKAGISGGGALPSYVDKFFRAVGISVPRRLRAYRNRSYPGGTKRFETNSQYCRSAS